MKNQARFNYAQKHIEQLIYQLRFLMNQENVDGEELTDLIRDAVTLEHRLDRLQIDYTIKKQEVNNAN